MSGALGALQSFSWRGIRVPVIGRSASFSHEVAQHGPLNQGPAYQEPLHRLNWELSYTLPMFDGYREPYGPLFTETLPQLLAAMVDGSPGPIIDPIIGEIRCVPLSYADSLDSAKRSGVEPTITFREAPPEATREPFRAPTLRAIEQQAVDLDAELTTVPWTRATPQPVPPLIDPFSIISILDSQFNRYNEKLDAMLANIIRLAERNEAALARLARPQDNPTRKRLRVLQLACRDFARQGPDVTRPVRVYVVPETTSTTQVASDVGMRLSQFLELNPKLGGAVVEKGTRVTVYK